MNRTIQTGALVAVSILIMCCSGCGGRQIVLVTGFWPPTNEMLTEYSKDPQLNPGPWKGKNFQNTGYDVYAWFPVFPKGAYEDPKGEGPFPVDYDQALDQFKLLTRTLRPAAIICYDQGDWPWEFEMNFPLHTHWIPDYEEPTLPHCVCDFGYRREYGDVLHSTLPVAEIAAEVSAAVPELEIVIDQDGDAGQFVAAYIAFAAADYQATRSFCQYAGMIRVGCDVPPRTAKKANDAALKAVIDALNKAP